MKFCLGGVSAATWQARRELQLLLPCLASEGHVLVDPQDATAVLAYGRPTAGDFLLDKPIVLRWDDTCSVGDVGAQGLSAVIFGSHYEAGGGRHLLPRGVASYVCHGAVDTEALATEAPPGLAAVRSQFPHLVTCEVAPGEVSHCVQAFRQLKSSGRYAGCGLVVVGEVSPEEVRLLSGVDVFHVEGLSHSDWLALLSLSSALLCLRFTTAVPHSVLESLSQGTPVLHCRQPGVVEVVRTAGGPWDSPGDAQKYPWDLSGVSPAAAARIFSRALLEAE